MLILGRSPRIMAALVVSHLCGLMMFGSAAYSDGEVNVYSYRKPQLIKPMFDRFTEQTGIVVNSVFAKKGMLERLASEGMNSPADLIFTSDIGVINDMKQAGLTQSVDSKQIASHIPDNLRDPENHWFGLTSRARIIVASKDRVGEDEALSYEALADSGLKGRVCTRSGKHAYNIALVSMMMLHHGEQDAEQWLANVKDNLARKPQGNDRAQVKAIHAGQCDVAVINHYYMHQMANDPEQKPWHDAVRVIFPNQNDRGTHMNISGMAMTRHSPNAENAKALMEFLAGDEAQTMYAEVNGEYPANPDISVGGYLADLGEFKQDTLGLSDVADLRADASKMVDRVGFDN